MLDFAATVAVISYNSSKFIRETLDSIITQTYDDIKLIVADDWINKNKARFISTKVITSYTNTGLKRGIVTTFIT